MICLLKFFDSLFFVFIEIDEPLVIHGFLNFCSRLVIFRKGACLFNVSLKILTKFSQISSGFDSDIGDWLNLYN